MCDEILMYTGVHNTSPYQKKHDEFYFPNEKWIEIDKSFKANKLNANKKKSCKQTDRSNQDFVNKEWA